MVQWSADPDNRRAPGRAAVLVGLLIVAGVALRGHLPGVEHTAGRQESGGNPPSLVAVGALVGVSLAILLFSLIVHLRQRRTLPEPDQMFGRALREHRWRYLLIALAMVVGSLLTVALLARLGSPVQPEDPGLDVNPASPPGVAPASPTRPMDPAEPAGWATPLFGFFVATMVAMMLVAATARLIATRRRRAAADIPVLLDSHQPASAATDSHSLVRAAELGLAEIADVSREPRAAIIACYAAMERELARVPDIVPQDCDTPTEVLARAVDHRALRTRTATRLVDLFEEARFSPHVMTEEHRQTAVRVLQLVLAELRSAT